MRTARFSPLSVVLAALVGTVACGGKVVGIPAADCPPVSEVSNGLACVNAGQSCTSAVLNDACTGSGSPTAAQCTCEGGTWTCAVPCAPPTGCPTAFSITNGGSCSTLPELACPTTTPVLGCDGSVQGYVTCSCAQGAWSCAEPGPPDCPDVTPPPPPPTPSCPSPTQVNSGIGCLSPGLQCPGNPQPCGSQTFYDVFECDAGKWNQIVATACDVDAG